MTAKNVLIGGSLILAILLVGSLVVTATIVNFGSSGQDSNAVITESQAVSIASQATKVTAKAENINKKVIEKDNENEEDESEDVPITGSALDKASAAALKHIGEGRVTDTETGDEEGYYEIEITTDDGREVDVHFDENFKVLSEEWEDDEEDDD